jgi:general secretion pathway protein M
MKPKEAVARIKERMDALEERERKLLVIFLGVLGVMVVFLVPFFVAMSVSSQADENERIREVIQSIADERVTLGRRQADSGRVDKRYGRKAPDLAGFLAQTAERAGVEIPETQDRSTVPHGKTFKERVTKISVRKVGMLNLSNFLSQIENSGYAVSISRLKIRKLSNIDDSFDAEVEVSAFVREEKKKPKAQEKVSDEAGEVEDGE